MMPAIVSAGTVARRIVALFDGEAPGPELSIMGPRDAHAAPPGDYVLFAMRHDGLRFVPSAARMVRVG